jgi:hypothetical protein
MIFTSQSGLTDTSRSALWDAWYLGHLEAMAAVPGIGSAQRFAALAAGPPPSLAMYSIASPAVFDSAIYLRTRGMGPWQPLIDPRHYRRNLFEGLDRAPVVAPDAILVVVDRPEPIAARPTSSGSAPSGSIARPRCAASRCSGRTRRGGLPRRSTAPSRSTVR